MNSIPHPQPNMGPLQKVLTADFMPPGWELYRILKRKYKPIFIVFDERGFYRGFLTSIHEARCYFTAKNKVRELFENKCAGSLSKRPAGISDERLAKISHSHGNVGWGHKTSAL